MGEIFLYNKVCDTEISFGIFSNLVDMSQATTYYVLAELQKVNTFTQAAFLGSKNLPQKCVIHDNFSPIKSA